MLTGRIVFDTRQHLFSCVGWMAVILLLGTGCAGLTTRPQPPRVTLADVRLQEIGVFEQRYRLKLRIQNPNTFALPIQGMHCAFFLNDRAFAHGVNNEQVTIPAFGEKLFSVDVVSQLQDLVTQLRALGSDRAPNLHYRLAGSVSLANWNELIPFSYQGKLRFPDAASRVPESDLSSDESH